jgi:hypothetical protein
VTDDGARSPLSIYATRAEGWIAAAQKRAAAGFDHFPRCRTCHRPMICGQEASNGGRHYTCTEGAS